MIPLIIGWLVKAGLSQSGAQKLAKPLLIAGGLLLAALAFTLWLHFHDNDVISHAQDKSEAKAAPIVRKADENATDSRSRSDNAVQQQQQEIHNAIDPLPDQGLTPRQRARACAILLRQAHERGTEAPAGC